MTSSHYIPFSHALMVALQLKTSGRSKFLGISSTRSRDFNQCTPFSQELIAALQLNKSTKSSLLEASCSNTTAVSHNTPFSHMLIISLHVITAYLSNL